MKQLNQWVIVGKFGRPHGVKGWISVYSYTDPATNLIQFSDWYIKQKDKFIPLKIVGLEPHARAYIVQIEGYKDREEAAKLTNLEIAVTLDELPPLGEDEFYWYQLIGLDVVSTSGFSFGKVVDIMETGANDVLVVEGNNRYLIPYRYGDVVQQVLKDKKQIIVDWDAEFL